LTPAKVQQLSALPRDLYVDCGDSIKTGNLGIAVGIDPVWERLASAGCTFGTLGNRESHVTESLFQAKMRGCKHEVLVANLFRKDGGLVYPPSKIVQLSGVSIGIIGVMVPMVTAKMKSQAMSAFLWTDPIEAALQAAEELRPQVDVLVALTHIGIRQDRTLAEKCDLINIICGGHSHTVLEMPEKVGRTWISHTGSHGRFVGSYVWDGVKLDGGLIPLD